MKLRYGTADENVRKRSIEDVVLHEWQRFEKKSAGHSSRAGKTPGNGEREEKKDQGPDRMEFYEGWKTGYALFSPACAGYLAVVSCVNQLAAERIRADVFSPAVLLPPDSEEEMLRIQIRQICDAAFSHGIRIGEVHAEVTDAVTRPVVFGTAGGRSFSAPEIWSETQTSFRCKREKESAIISSAMPGHYCGQAWSEDPYALKESRDIVLAGPVGMEGTWILVMEEMEKLKKRFPASLLSRMKDLRENLCVLRLAEAAVGYESGRPGIEITETGDLMSGGSCSAIIQHLPMMVSLGDGGFFTGLWELAAKTGCGLDVDLQAVPLLQETIEITNELGINPYMMRSSGSLLIVSGDGRQLADYLRERGIRAARIGQLTDGKDKVIRNGEEVRYLDRPQTDSLAAFFRGR